MRFLREVLSNKECIKRYDILEKIVKEKKNEKLSARKCVNYSKNDKDGHFITIRSDMCAVIKHSADIDDGELKWQIQYVNIAL